MIQAMHTDDSIHMTKITPPSITPHTHPQWLRSLIKTIFVPGNHLLAITSVGLMTLIWFNCIHLAVKGESCTHFTPHRWQQSMLRGHKCLCPHGRDIKGTCAYFKYTICLVLGSCERLCVHKYKWVMYEDVCMFVTVWGKEQVRQKKETEMRVYGVCVAGVWAQRHWGINIY